MNQRAIVLAVYFLDGSLCAAQLVQGKSPEHVLANISGPDSPVIAYEALRNVVVTRVDEHPAYERGVRSLREYAAVSEPNAFTRRVLYSYLPGVYTRDTDPRPVQVRVHALPKAPSDLMVLHQMSAARAWADKGVAEDRLNGFLIIGDDAVTMPLPEFDANTVKEAFDQLRAIKIDVERKVQEQAERLALALNHVIALQGGTDNVRAGIRASFDHVPRAQIIGAPVFPPTEIKVTGVEIDCMVNF